MNKEPFVMTLFGKDYKKGWGLTLAPVIDARLGDGTALLSIPYMILSGRNVSTIKVKIIIFSCV